MNYLPSILCGLVAMICYGASTAQGKPLILHYGSARFLFLRGFGMTSMTLLAMLLATPLKLEPLGFLAAFMLGLIGYLPVLSFSFALKKGRIGIIAPIGSAAPLITVLLATIFLGTTLSHLQWTGIFLIVSANIGFCLNFQNQPDQKFSSNFQSYALALFAAVGWGIYYYLLALIAHKMGPWLAAFASECGVTAAAALHLYALREKLGLNECIKPKIILNALFCGLGTIFYTIGVTQFDVSIVATLANSTSIVSVLLGHFVLKEHLSIKEVMAGLVLTAGVCVITLG